MNIKIIAFDADDTLWHNEQYFRDTENRFYELLEDFMSHHSISKELLNVEIANIELYGYGVKSFVLSMIETAIRISGKTIDAETIAKIIEYGKVHLDKPVKLMDGIEDVLEQLKNKYRLVMATKGDLLDQERKLNKSGLEKYFHHIEVMSEKKEDDYNKLIHHLDIHPSEFLMIGNSVKSDIIPVLNIGGHAIHIPYHVTWEHEHSEVKVEHPNFRHVEKAPDILELINGS